MRKYFLKVTTAQIMRNRLDTTQETVAVHVFEFWQFYLAPNEIMNTLSKAATKPASLLNAVTTSTLYFLCTLSIVCT